MNDINAYKEQLFTFNNPIFFAFILTVVVIFLLILFYIKIVYPLQKKFIVENQRYLLEKAELMALFAELDPDPLLRINSNGELLQTNEAFRKLFPKKSYNKELLTKIIPEEFYNTNSLPAKRVQLIEGNYYNINVRKEEKLGFTNIYLHDITESKKYEKQLEIYKANLAMFSNAIDKQYEELKKSLASNLHDDIGQRMIVAKLKLAQLDKYDVKDIQEDLEALSSQIRDLSHNLAPINVNNLGLVFSLGRIIKDMSEISGIKSRFNTSHSEEEFEQLLSENIKQCVYLSVKEGLNNIVKHSKAQNLAISMLIVDDLLELSIADNGEGMSDQLDTIVLSNDSGFGLFRMRERIRNLGGTFDIISTEEYSTVLFIRIPLGK